MNVRVTILVENTSPTPGITGEYGFSALLDVDGKKLLFDAGSAGALFANADKLHVDLNQVDALVLSHGHFDHTGGLLEFLKRFGTRKIFAHSNMFARRPMKTPKSFSEIGCPFQREELEEAGGEFVFVDKFTEIYPEIFISGEIPRETAYEDVGGSGNFKIQVDDRLEDDMIKDDMALIINHPLGLLILSGCAHSGIINTINYAIQETGQSHILAYIGGTHLIGASIERLQQTAQALKEKDIKQVIVAHCTGFEAASHLRQELGKQLVKAEAGMVFKF
ncbi:MAG TPA: MBL fold metallo-hydrolase [Syntrophomonadaceae bacterium]|nr:MBL fold metallo-hydrolase [Syntrophomonadaceae bacterium]